jgi:hypothetical protein
MKSRFKVISGLLAAGAVLINVLPAQAGAARSLPADPPLGAKEAPPRQCSRRNNNNDIYYVNCGPISPFAAAPAPGLLESLGRAVQQALQ